MQKSTEKGCKKDLTNYLEWVIHPDVFDSITNQSEKDVTRVHLGEMLFDSGIYHFKIPFLKLDPKIKKQSFEDIEKIREHIIKEYIKN